MSTFTQAGGFTLYQYVQHSENPRYPYGLCGPFASETEAAEALERITTAFPAVELHIEQAGFAGNAHQMLSRDNAKARLRLAKLRV